jgi:hypothetical protein
MHDKFLMLFCCRALSFCATGYLLPITSCVSLLSAQHDFALGYCYYLSFDVSFHYCTLLFHVKILLLLSFHVLFYYFMREYS